VKKRELYKLNQEKTQTRRLVLILIATVVLLIALFAMSKLGNKPSNPRPVRTLSIDPSDDLQAKYDELVNHITRTNVCPAVHPVHIFREVDGRMFLHATGGQLVNDGRILTCGHAFWDIPGEGKKPWRFYYQILEPYDKTFYPINKIEVVSRVETNAINASQDVIVCVPGPAELIAPLAPPAEAIGGETNLTVNGITRFDEPLIIRSTVTGERIRLIGSVRVVGGASYFVLDCNTFKTQSGTIYARADNKELYILSKSALLTPGLRKKYRLDETRVGITFCSSVKLN
jgi:hypothetical protein